MFTLREVLFDILVRTKDLLGLLSGIGFVGMIVSSLFYVSNSSVYMSESAKNILIYSSLSFKICLGFFISGIISLIIPTPSSLFETRMSLLKLELTKKENIEEVVDNVGRVIKKLEDKYFKGESNDDKNKEA